MNGKKILVLLWLAGAGMVFLVQGQNARIDAMGGAFIVKDFSKTLYNPAIMNDYKDHAELTFNPSAVLATKSAGSAFSLGVVMNRGLMLRYFYSIADSALDYFTGSRLPGAPTMQYFPHILWGIDLATVQIGFDTYLEWDRATYNSLVEVPGAFQEMDGKLTISHPGCIAGFKFNLNSATVLLHLGGGLPRATGTLERTNIGTAKIETETGIFGRAGGEVTTRVKALDLTIGAEGRYEKFQFSSLDPSPNAEKIRTEKTTIQTAIPYIGATATLSNGVLVVGMGRSSIDIMKVENDDGDTSAIEYNLRHSLICGFEKQVKKPWKFDSLAVRGGVSWGAFNSWTDFQSTTVPTTQVTSKPISTLGPAYPYFGFGASKSFFTMDLMLSPASWASAFTGPAVSRATITLRY
jgi:hypothetical protein